jgi:Spy/CpxP family protein refolding chaperone
MTPFPLSSKALPLAGTLLVLGLGVSLGAAVPLQGQHAGHDPSMHGGGESTASPYAGLLAREIRALAPEEIASLLAGEGMGFALAAELNGIPGPLHVLELAEELALTSEQRGQIEALFQSMRAEAAAMGAQVVELERTLDRRFRHRQLDASAIGELTGQIASLKGRIRALHLSTHLEMEPLLNEEQRARYQVLRGYAPEG